MAKKNGLVVTHKVEKDLEQYQVYLNQIQGINSYSEFPEMPDNPFICLLSDVVSTKWKSKGFINGVGRGEMVNKTTGEIEPLSGNMIFGKTQELDSNQFTKLYNAQLKILFNLGHPALKVYGYFIKEMQDKKDNMDVYFGLQDCMDFCMYDSKTMIYRGLTELILKGFICKTTRPWVFYVNPLYAFNGNRITVYQEYVKAGTDISNDIQSEPKKISEEW